MICRISNFIVFLSLFASVIGTSWASANGSLCEVDLKTAPRGSNTWTQQMIGNQWGWRLTVYDILHSIYTTDGQTLLLLGRAITDSDGIVWNPLSGACSHVNALELKALEVKHIRDFVASGIYTNMVNTLNLLPDGRRIHAFLSPATPYPCNSILAQYVDIPRDGPGSSKADLYVIRLLDNPRTIEYSSCAEAQSPVSHKINVDFAMDFDKATSLSDGTLLLFSNDEGGALFIIRLDSNLVPHSTIGGRVFVVNEREIDSRMDHPFDDLQFYNQLKSVLTKSIGLKITR